MLFRSALMKMAVKGDANALGQLPDTLSLFLGNNPGSLGEVSALAVISYNYYTNKIDKLTYGLDEVGFSIVQTFAATH